MRAQKSFEISLWGLSALGGLAAVVLVSMIAPPAMAGEPVSILTASRGEVAIARDASVSGGDAPMRASLREVLYEGDVLTTGPGAKAKLLIGDDTLVVIGEDAELKIDHVAPSPAAGEPSVRLTVRRGLVRAAFQPSRQASPKPTLAIETPLAVLAAAGDSESYVDVSEGAVRLWSVESTWEVRPTGPNPPQADGAFSLAPGHVMDLSASGGAVGPGEAKPTQPEELRAVRSEVSLMETALTRPRPSNDKGDFIYEDYASRGWMFASDSKKEYRTAAASTSRKALRSNGHSAQASEPSVNLVSAIPQGVVDALHKGLVSVFAEGEQ